MDHINTNSKSNSSGYSDEPDMKPASHGMVDVSYSLLFFGILAALFYYTDIFNASFTGQNIEKYKFEVKKAVDVK